MRTLILLLLLVPSQLKAQDSSDFDVYPSVRAIAGYDIWNDGGIVGMHYYMRNYQRNAWIPGIGIRYSFYDRFENFENSELILDLSQLIQFRIGKVVNFRIQPVTGARIAQVQYPKKEILITPYGSASLGLGLSLWRLDLAMDVGVRYDYDFLPSVEFSLGYVFNPGSKLIEPYAPEPGSKFISKTYRISVFANAFYAGRYYSPNTSGLNLQCLLRGRQRFSFVPGLGFSNYTLKRELASDIKGNSLEGYAYFEYKPFPNVFARFGGMIGMEKSNGYSKEWSHVAGALSGIGFEKDRFTFLLEGGWVRYLQFRFNQIKIGAGYSF